MFLKAHLNLLSYNKKHFAELKVRWRMRDCNTASQERGMILMVPEEKTICLLSRWSSFLWRWKVFILTTAPFRTDFLHVALFPLQFSGQRNDRTDPSSKISFSACFYEHSHAPQRREEASYAETSTTSAWLDYLRIILVWFYRIIHE